jgi:hypothetical protein
MRLERMSKINTTYTVRQNFEIFGNSGEETFETEQAAEEYAVEFAEEIAEAFYERQGDFAVQVGNEGLSVGSMREIEWTRNLDWECAEHGDDDACTDDGEPSACEFRIDWDTLISKIREGAIEVTRRVVVETDEEDELEIENHYDQEIAVALARHGVKLTHRGDKFLYGSNQCAPIAE